MVRYLQHIKPSSFFIVVAVFIELLLNIVTPPLQAPDEFSHFYRAYQIASGHFFPEKTDQRVGGMIPQGMSDFASQHKVSAYMMDYTLDHREILRSCRIKLQEDTLIFRDFSNTAFYSPVSYLPQAFVIFVLKKLSDNVSLLYYGGRVFTFLVWLFCMAFVIRTIPVFKWLFTLLILLPMNPYIANSFSADAATNIICFLFISQVLKHVFVTEKITKWHLLELAVLAILLVLAKFVYVGILFMLLLIPKTKFRSRFSWIFSIGFIFLLSSVVILSWSGSVMSFYIPIKDYNPDYRSVSCLSPCGDYAAQQSYILHHGFYFFKVIFNSLFSHPRTYLSGYIGVFGNGDIGMPIWLYSFSYIFICAVALSEKNSFSFSFLQKIIIFCAALSSYVVLLLSIHLAWDCVGEGIVDLVQGRYLIPVFPLLFILLDNRIPALKLNMTVFIIVVVCILNLYAFKVIYDRFFVGKPCDKKEIYCDSETLDIYGAFKTNDYDVFLQNPNCRTSKEHRSGSFSAFISPESPFCYTYKFSGVLPGDIIEMEAWEKGKGALIVISGEQQHCGDFYFAGTYNSYKDKLGWQRIKNVYQVKPRCDSLKMGIYIWNPGKSGVYVDDIKFTIKKFKGGR